MSASPSTRVRFGRRVLAVPHGTSLLNALTGGRIVPLQRSVRYHRPRALFCGVGDCTNCLVRVNGVPNVRSCRYEPHDGDVVRTENAWPSPSLDVFGGLDFLFPGGIDTLRGFRRPRWFTPLYHRVVRRLAGYGSYPTPGPGTPFSSKEITTEVVVVGAGPAGRAAASRLGKAGRRTILIDRGTPTGPPSEQDTYARTTAVFLPPPTPGAIRPFDLLAVRGGVASLRFHAAKVVISVGGYDSNLLFPGNDRPGVLTGDALETLPGRAGGRGSVRALLFGGGWRAGSLLRRYRDLFVAVAAPGPIDAEVAGLATDLGIPLYPRSLLLEAQGRRKVRRVILKDRVQGPRTELNVDAVVLAHRRLPHSQLLFQAGARMRWVSDPGAYVPETSPVGETTVEGLYASGASVGATDPESATRSGDSVAAAILGESSGSASPSRTGPGPGEMEGYYAELLSHLRTGPKCMACSCEDILLDEVLHASSRNYRGIEVVKRYTGLGTGLCQGRYCVPEALLILSHTEKRPPPDVGYITQRPPVVPVVLGALAELAASTNSAPEAR